MKKLFIKTENAMLPLDLNLIEKYNLKAGDRSPDNRYKIVDEYGNEVKQDDDKEVKYNRDELMSDGQIFRASEVLDLAEGVDSEP